MNRERTVEIWKHELFDDVVEELATYAELDRAIGYLSRWAVGAKNKCRAVITCGHNGDILARYYDGDNKLTYEIGAVLREDGTYSFHS